MRYGLYVVLLAAIVLFLNIVLKLPFFLEVFIVIPLIIILVTYIISLYNFYAGLGILPVPAKGYANRIEKSNIDTLKLEKLEFKKTDTFYLKTIPDCIVTVFKHTSDPIFGCIYNYGPKKEFEFLTDFKNISLTTCSDKCIGNSPRLVRDMVQGFHDEDIFFLLSEHKRAIYFLRKNHFDPVNMQGSNFRQFFVALTERNNKYLRSYPLWMFRMFYWILTKYGKKYAYSIEEQITGAADQSKPNRKLQNDLKQVLTEAKSKTNCRVIFDGSIREGYTIDGVKNNLSKLFKLDREKIDRLFQGRKIVIKSNVDHQLANKYKNAFYKAGAICLIESASSKISEEAYHGTSPAHSTRVIKEEKIGCFAYALAVSSFIPLYGVPMGIVSIILGYIKRKIGGWKIALIGGLGILFTVVSYSGSLLILDIFKKHGTIDQLKHKMVQQHLTKLVESIEFYKLRYNHYPESLYQLKNDSQEHIWIWDAAEQKSSNKEPRIYFYEVDSSGTFYYLLSTGADGLLLTEDDIYPTISESEATNLGYRIKKNDSTPGF